MNLVEIDIRANDLTGPGFASALARAEALRKILKDSSLLGFDPQEVDSQLSVLKSKLQAHGVADLLDINMNAGQVEQQLMLLKRRVGDAKIGDLLDVNLDEGAIGRQLSALEGDDHVLRFTPEFTKNIDLGNLPVRGDVLHIGGAEQLKALGAESDALIGEMTALWAESDKLRTGFNDLGKAAEAAAGGKGGSGGGGMAALGGAAGGTGRRLFGWGAILGGTTGGIKLWHVALDGALESLIAVGAAAAALTVGIASMVPASKDIYTHLKAVQAVNAALGTQIPPLTGGFARLGQAMAPQTIEAYGGALNLVSSNSGTLARVAREVVTGIDDVVAKFDLWNGSQKHTGALLQDGVGFLRQFGHILGDVGGAIGNLVKADPGTAHFLLDIIGGAAKLLDVATKLPTPLLGAAFALHSVYLWGNVASGSLGKMTSKIPGMQKLSDLLAHGLHMSALSTPQLLGITAVIAAVADVAVNWDKADAAARSYINSIDTGLANSQASTAIAQITTDIGDLNLKIRDAFSPSQMAQIARTWNALGSTGMAFGADTKAVAHDVATAFDRMTSGHILSGLAALGRGIEGVFVPGQGEAQVAANNVGAYGAEIVKLLGQQKNLFGETGKLIGQGYTYAQSLALMDLAGVRAGDSMALMNQKVANLITGYQNMSVRGGMLSNSVNAVTFASLQQQSQVGQLNSAWDTFFQAVSGGESGFETFAQQTIGLYQSLTTAGLKVTDSNGKVGSSLQLLASNAGGAKVSMTGLNSASLTARQTFVQSASAANSEMDALTTLASAAGLGAQGSDMLVRASKDLVASLLPAAKGSSDMTAILYDLAQRGGYTGADSFQALSKWVANTKTPMQDLQGIVGTLTKAAGNLTADVQNLSTALGTTLNDAMATAMFDASGGQKTFDNFAAAVQKTGADSRTTRADALKLAEGLTQLTGNTGDAKAEFLSFAEGALHLTQAQADTLWKQTLPGLQGYIDKMHGKQLDLGISLPTSKLETFQQMVDSLHGTEVQIGAQLVGPAALVQALTQQGYATGGVVGHAASGGVRNGMVMVGELGPELVSLPQGSRVWPRGITPPGMQGGGYGGWDGGAQPVQVVLEVHPGGSGLDRLFISWLQETIRHKGGGGPNSVQRAFGRTWAGR